LIQRHPRIGREILEKVARFEPFLPIVELHHENPDGSGYPYGLRQSEIPIGVRIVHVADVYDAITSDRAYRSAMPEEQAWDLLLGGMGTLFESDVIEALWSIVQTGPFPHGSVERPPTHENDSAFYSLPRTP
jgi:response regulator RpfG family c-di-GMP phosphodiesterase